jgi:alpha-glucan, water dikinase
LSWRKHFSISNSINYGENTFLYEINKLCIMQVVKGLGETLVGAYPGRALSFVCKKSVLNSPKVSMKYSIHCCFKLMVRNIPKISSNICTTSFSLLNSELQKQVLGYPSKPIGLFIKRSIIFRSDSNGEDLEGYAGAGLYDR